MLPGQSPTVVQDSSAQVPANREDSEDASLVNRRTKGAAETMLAQGFGDKGRNWPWVPMGREHTHVSLVQESLRSQLGTWKVTCRGCIFLADT